MTTVSHPSLDLRKFSTRNWICEDRFGTYDARNILSIFMTQSFAGFLASAEICIADFSSEHNHLTSIDVPGPADQNSTAVASGHRVAVLSSEHQYRTSHIWIYDHFNRSACTFSILAINPLNGELPAPPGMHLNDERLLLFRPYEKDEITRLLHVEAVYFTGKRHWSQLWAGVV